MERVVISFISVNLEYSNGDPSDPSNCSGMDTISIESPSTTSSLTSPKNKNRDVIGVYCGSKLPPRTMSSQRIMRVTFSTGVTGSNTFGNGFFAKFEFVRDLGIKSGLQDLSQDCRFFFRSPYGHPPPSTPPKQRSRRGHPRPPRHRQFQFLSQRRSSIFHQGDRPPKVKICNEDDGDNDDDDDDDDGEGDNCSGVVHSPNYPGLYPKNTTCEYIFHVGSKEELEVTFVHFDVEGLPPVCSDSTKSDYLEISQAEPQDLPTHSSAKRHSKLQPSSSQPEIDRVLHNDRLPSSSSSSSSSPSSSSSSSSPSSSSSSKSGKLRRVDCKNEDVFRIFYGLKLAGNSKIRNTGHVTDDVVQMTLNEEEDDDDDDDRGDDDDDDDRGDDDDDDDHGDDDADDQFGGDDDRYDVGDNDVHGGGDAVDGDDDTSINYDKYAGGRQGAFLSEPIHIAGHNDGDDDDDDGDDDDGDDDDDDNGNELNYYLNSYNDGKRTHKHGDDIADDDSYGNDDNHGDDDDYYFADGPAVEPHDVRVKEDNNGTTRQSNKKDEDDDDDDDDDQGDDDDVESNGNLRDSEQEVATGNDEKKRNSGRKFQNNTHDRPSMNVEHPDNDDHLSHLHHHHHRQQQQQQRQNHHQQQQQQQHLDKRNKMNYIRQSECSDPIKCLPVPSLEPTIERSSDNLTSDLPSNSTRPSNPTTNSAINHVTSGEPIRWRVEVPPPTRTANHRRVVAFHRFGAPRNLQTPMRLCGSKDDLKQLTFAFSGPYVTLTFQSNDMYDAMGFKCRYRFLKKKGMQAAGTTRLTLTPTQLQMWVIAIVVVVVIFL